MAQKRKKRLDVNQRVKRQESKRPGLRGTRHRLVQRAGARGDSKWGDQGRALFMKNLTRQMEEKRRECDLKRPSVNRVKNSSPQREKKLWKKRTFQWGKISGENRSSDVQSKQLHKGNSDDLGRGYARNFLGKRILPGAGSGISYSEAGRRA